MLFKAKYKSELQKEFECWERAQSWGASLLLKLLVSLITILTLLGLIMVALSKLNVEHGDRFSEIIMVITIPLAFYSIVRSEEARRYRLFMHQRRQADALLNE